MHTHQLLPFIWHHGLFIIFDILVRDNWDKITDFRNSTHPTSTTGEGLQLIVLRILYSSKITWYVRLYSTHVNYIISMRSVDYRSFCDNFFKIIEMTYILALLNGPWNVHLAAWFLIEAEICHQWYVTGTSLVPKGIEDVNIKQHYQLQGGYMTVYHFLIP